MSTSSALQHIAALTSTPDQSRVACKYLIDTLSNIASDENSPSIASPQIAAPRLAALALATLSQQNASNLNENNIVAFTSPAHVALTTLCFRLAPHADVAPVLKALARVDATHVELLNVGANRCESPQLLMQLLRRCLNTPAAASALVAAVRRQVANARTKNDLFLAHVLSPALADAPVDGAVLTLLRLVVADVVVDERSKMIASLAASQSIARSFVNAALALPDASATIGPALFSAIVGLPQLERLVAVMPLSSADDAVVVRHGVLLADHAKAVVSLARELLTALLAALKALAADDVLRADRCVDSIAGIVRRVALSGQYLPNGSLDDDIDRAASAVLASKASLDCKGDFFAVLLGVNMRFVLARRRALLARLWAAGGAVRRAEPNVDVITTIGLFDNSSATDNNNRQQRGAKGLLIALVEASARARQLPETIDDMLHSFETVQCDAHDGASLFDDEWLDSMTRSYRACAPAQITEILTKSCAVFRSGAFFVFDAPQHSAAMARGFVVGWRLFANVLVGAVHISATRRHELHAELSSMWTEWLAPVVSERTAAQCEAAASPERVMALCAVCVQLASALERCEMLLESGGGDEDDINDANTTADAPLLATAVATALAQSAVVEWLSGKLANDANNVDVAYTLLSLWALLVRVAPELEGVVSVRACLEVGAESVWRVAVHSISALAQRTDSTELIALLVNAALPASRARHSEKRKRRSVASATTAPSAVCTDALRQDYVYQLFDVREPLSRALVERLVAAVRDDGECAAIADRVKKLGAAGSVDDVAKQLDGASVERADGAASTDGDVVAVLRTMARVPALFWPEPLAARAAAIAMLIRLLYPAHEAARELLASLPESAVCVAVALPNAMTVLLDDSALLMRLCQQLCERAVARSTREQSLATLNSLLPLLARGDNVALVLSQCVASAARAVPNARAATSALIDAVDAAVIGAIANESDSAIDVSTLCRATAVALLLAHERRDKSDKDGAATLTNAATTLVARLTVAPGDVSTTALAALSLALLRVSPAAGGEVSPAAKQAVELLLQTTYDQEQLVPLLRSKPLRPTLRYLLRSLVRGVGHARNSFASGCAAQEFLLEVLLDIGYVNRASLLRGNVRIDLLKAIGELCADAVAAGDLAACAAPLKCLETVVADDLVKLTNWELASVLRCANLVVSTSAPAAHATMELACRVASAVLRRRDKATEHLSGLMSVLLRALTARTFDANASASPSSAASVLALTDAFVRTLSALATTDNRKVYTRGIAYLASDYLGWLERVAVRNIECRALLSRGLWYMFDVCNASHFKVIYETATSVGKQLFKQQREAFTTEHQNSGVV
jgi:hypothetical protein